MILLLVKMLHPFSSISPFFIYEGCEEDMVENLQLHRMTWKNTILFSDRMRNPPYDRVNVWRVKAAKVCRGL